MRYFYPILSIVAGLLVFITKGSPATALTVLAIYLVLMGIWKATDIK